MFYPFFCDKTIIHKDIILELLHCVIQLKTGIWLVWCIGCHTQDTCVRLSYTRYMCHTFIHKIHVSDFHTQDTCVRLSYTRYMCQTYIHNIHVSDFHTQDTCATLWYTRYMCLTCIASPTIVFCKCFIYFSSLCYIVAHNAAVNVKLFMKLFMNYWWKGLCGGKLVLCVEDILKNTMKLLGQPGFVDTTHSLALHTLCRTILYNEMCPYTLVKP